MKTHEFVLTGSAGRPIRGALQLPGEAHPGGTPIVVAVHGFKGFRQWGFWAAMADRFTSEGFAFLGFDMSHNGVGEGGLEFDEKDLFEANTWAREEHDLGVVLDAVAAGEIPGADSIDPARLALLGHSRGGGLVVEKTAQDPRVRCAVVLAAIGTVRRFSDDVLDLGRREGFIPIRNMRTGEVLHFGADAIAEVTEREDLADIATTYAARIDVPLLVANGTADPAVDPDEGRRIAEAAPHGRFLPIEGADHVLGCRHPWQGTNPDFERFLDEAVGFVRSAISAG